MKSKIYLFAYESVGDDGGSCEQKAFTSKQAALDMLKKEVEEYKTEIASGNQYFDTCEEDELSVEFYNEGFYNQEHIKWSVEEVELEDALDFCTTENFVRNEIEMYFETFEIDANKHKKLAKRLTNKLVNDEYLWEHFNSEFMESMEEDEEYKKLYDEYMTRIEEGLNR